MNMNTMKVMRHGSIKLIIQKVFAHSYLSSFRLRSSLSIPHPSHWHPYLFFHTHWSTLDNVGTGPTGHPARKGEDLV